MQKHLPLIFVVTLAIVLASVMTFSIAGIATADTAKSPVDKLEIGQFSDIHYFPVDDCYQDINSSDYKTSDFYNSMTGDTKLVMESGMILKQQIEAFIEDAKKGIAPTYVFATGDLSKNGEVTALVDVANALRYLQIHRLSGFRNAGQPRPLQHVGRTLLQNRRFEACFRRFEFDAIRSRICRFGLPRCKP